MTEAIETKIGDEQQSPWRSIIDAVIECPEEDLAEKDLANHLGVKCKFKVNVKIFESMRWFPNLEKNSCDNPIELMCTIFIFFRETTTRSN